MIRGREQVGRDQGRERGRKVERERERGKGKEGGREREQRKGGRGRGGRERGREERSGGEFLLPHTQLCDRRLSDLFSLLEVFIDSPLVSRVVESCSKPSHYVREHS